MSNLKRWWWLGVVVFLSWFIYLLSPTLTPFFIAATLAYLGDPLADWLEERKFNRTMAVVIVFLLFTLIGFLFILMMIPMLKQQFDLLAGKTPVVIGYFKTEVVPWFAELLGKEQAEFNYKEVEEAVTKNLPNYGGVIGTVMKSITSSGIALFGWLGNLVLIPVVTFYLLRDWDKLVAHIYGLFPRRAAPVVKTLALECNEVLSAFVRGQLIVMFALGMIYAIGLWIVGLDLALLVGLIAGLASIVPYLGFIIGIIFAIAAGLIQFGEPQVLIWIGLVFAIGQMLEGMVLTPLLVGDKIGLHPVAVIFAILAGGQLFGFVGVLVALPVAAVIMVLLRHAHDKYINSVLYGGELPEGEIPKEVLQSANVISTDEKQK
ncbi:AI-2E family transporter [Pleionea sediminis]|uniref:AI-2E family transporter n=1 Tax=Pleionea sediminis TaxID=2569479 RepID=UPI00118677C7|nr:AI-2E family transporter [Pleionea sediminis]